MDTQTRILKLYAQLETIHRQALEHARQENWDEAAEIGVSAQTITSQLEALEANTVLSAQGLKEKQARVEQTLKLVAELRTLVEPARAESAALLSENALRGKLSNTYGV